VIGYYVHHVGSGHLHRARSIIAELDLPVVVLSSLPRPSAWQGDWVELPRDDDGPVTPDDVTAHGRFHWVPYHHPGLASRAAAVASWIASARPALLTVDVSVEIAVLARLHGIPVASMVLPGRRTDDAHLLGYAISCALIAAWPAGVGRMLPGMPTGARRRIEFVGGLSRFESAEPEPRRPGPLRVTVLLGRGGGAPTPEVIERARRGASGWEWRVLGADASTWVEDPFPWIREADVVVCQAGENAIAEVAAARRPAIVIPAPRPHDEQWIAARALERGGWPVVVRDSFPHGGWPALLEQAMRLDGRRWSDWCDGAAATRAAAVLTRHARSPVVSGS
jgi:hypothetical protein